MTEAAAVLGGPTPSHRWSRRLSTPPAPSPAVDAEWVAATAEQVLAAVEETPFDLADAGMSVPKPNATSAPSKLPAEQANTLVEMLVDEVLHAGR